MKNSTIQKLIKMTSVAVAVLALAGRTANAAGSEVVTAIGSVNGAETIFQFDPLVPGVILQSHNLSLPGGEVPRGIDWVAAGGIYYVLGSAANIYIVNPNTGAITPHAHIGALASLNGTYFGFEATPTGFVIAGGDRINQHVMVVNNSGGLVSSNAITGANGISALALNPADGLMYAFDRVNLAPGRIGTLTTGGVYANVGGTGIQGSVNNGFDVSLITGIAYLGTPQASGSGQPELYRINLATGSPSLVGMIGDADTFPIAFMRGLTVPEPSTVAMLGLGGLALAVSAWRRRK